MALGRMDQYLYELYRKDIQQGAANDADILNLLEAHL